MEIPFAGPPSMRFWPGGSPKACQLLLRTTASIKITVQIALEGDRPDAEFFPGAARRAAQPLVTGGADATIQYFLPGWPRPCSLALLSN
jgi:hypothetical protein